MTYFVCGITGHLYGDKKYKTLPNGEVVTTEKCVRCEDVKETKTGLVRGTPRNIDPKKLTGQS